MRKIFAFPLVLLGLLAWVGMASANLKDAVTKIGEVENLLKKGVTRAEYTQAILGMEAVVENYGNSGKADVEIKDLLGKIGNKFKQAGEVWKEEERVIIALLDRAKLNDLQGRRVEASDFKNQAETRTREISTKVNPLWAEAHEAFKRLVEMIIEKDLMWQLASSPPIKSG